MDLKVKMRSTDKTDIKYGFLDPKNPRKHMSISSLGQTIEKLTFKMTDGGGHLGFEGQNEVK